MSADKRREEEEPPWDDYSVAEFGPYLPAEDAVRIFAPAEDVGGRLPFGSVPPHNPRIC